MAEYTTSAKQTVAAGASVLYTNKPVGNCGGWAVHRDGSGLVMLRGGCRGARYKVAAGANIAIPTGGTVGPISVAIAIDGENLYGATGITTPTAVNAAENVFVEALVQVPAGCCLTVSVRNAAKVDIDVSNASLAIDRIG